MLRRLPVIAARRRDATTRARRRLYGYIQA
jgi:hypothetical protein